MVTVTLVAIWSALAVLLRAPVKLSVTLQRTAVTVAAAASAFLLAWIFWSVPRASASDLAPVWAGARALLHGENPYDIVGPGRAFDTTFPLIYPMPAVLTLAPIALLPLRWVDLVFVTFGFALFSWALMNRGALTPPTVALVSLPAMMALQTSQWSPLLVGAALVPSFGFLLVAKPTIGLALFTAFPTWRTAVGCALLLTASLLVSPGWITDWRAGLVTAPHVVAPITRLGGPLLLLGLLKWRRADARLLVALALVPHTTALYETLPLFILAETWAQAWGLWALAVIAYAGQWATGPYSSIGAHWAAGAQWIVVVMYLPCLVAVLRRSNVWSEADVQVMARALEWGSDLDFRGARKSRSDPEHAASKDATPAGTARRAAAGATAAAASDA